MTHLVEIYNELYDNGIYMSNREFNFSDPKCDAIAIESGGQYAIFFDIEKIHTIAEETVAVAHEAGHIMTGSMHQLSSTRDLIARHEYQADKWAIKKLIPRDELRKAIKQGHIEIWDLAEHFSVTEAFIRKTVDYYKHAHL